MARPVLTQTQLAAAMKGFVRAGLSPHRAIVKRDSTTVFFNPDLPDDVFDREDPDEALAEWEKTMNE